MRLLFATLFAIACNAAIADDCLKLVLAKYCLGGPVVELLKTTKPNTQNHRGKVSYLFFEGNEVLVTAFDNRIARIAKKFMPGSYLVYRDTLTDLNQIYGKGTDKSYFPSYATDDSAKETSVVIGKGKGFIYWRPEGYKVLLTWRSSDYLTVSYFHNELSDAVQEDEKKLSGSL